MSDNTIPNSDGDYIANIQPANWSTGECVPVWKYILMENTPISADTEMGNFN